MSFTSSPTRKWILEFLRGDRMGALGLVGVVLMLLVALYAPFIANGRPLLLWRYGEGLELPFLRFVFAPDSTEGLIEKIFNFAMIMLPVAAAVEILGRRIPRSRRWPALAILALGLLLPFLGVQRRLERTDWRLAAAGLEADGKGFAVFAPVRYGPNENVAPPYQKASPRHWLGTDQIGRDVLSRMVYGARVSLAVGLLATALAVVVGIMVGMCSGYFGGLADIAIMRIVEIIICFPTFLLLLILMAIMMDYKFEQSILMVILVIGATGWTGIARLVRGEVLKQRSLPYIQSCVALGIPTWRIMLFHLLPNVAGVILVSFTFSVAGAILAESGLSFLGFGVRQPTASWGELLRQAFTDPFQYWHLTLWPGVALFATVTAFNFLGEGLRKQLDPKTN